ACTSALILDVDGRLGKRFFQLRDFGLAEAVVRELDLGERGQLVEVIGELLEAVELEVDLLETLELADAPQGRVRHISALGVVALAPAIDAEVRQGRQLHREQLREDVVGGLPDVDEAAEVQYPQLWQLREVRQLPQATERAAEVELLEVLQHVELRDRGER